MLPIPADLIQTAALERNEAIIGIAHQYFMGLGVTGKKGVITQDDSVRFLQDERAYKAKLQGNGRPMDEYAFLLLDLSKLETTIPQPVRVVDPVTTQAKA